MQSEILHFKIHDFGRIKIKQKSSLEFTWTDLQPIFSSRLGFEVERIHSKQINWTQKETDLYLHQKL